MDVKRWVEVTLRLNDLVQVSRGVKPDVWAMASYAAPGSVSLLTRFKSVKRTVVDLAWDGASGDGRDGLTSIVD